MFCTNAEHFLKTAVVSRCIDPAETAQFFTGSIHDFLPGHAVGQHRQRVAQIDHLIQAVTEKVIGHGAAFKNSQKTGSIEYLFESSDHRDSPQITSIHAGCRGFAGATN
jgi:hypothetical protein